VTGPAFFKLFLLIFIAFGREFGGTSLDDACDVDDAMKSSPLSSSDFKDLVTYNCGIYAQQTLVIPTSTLNHVPFIC